MIRKTKIISGFLLFFFGGVVFQVYRREVRVSFCGDTGTIKEKSEGWCEASVKH